MSYKKLSELVHLVDIKNTDCKVTRVIGVSITKNFIPSVANLNGVDLTKYNLIKKNQFACKLMSVGRDLQLPIDLYKEDDLALISSAYYVFEVKDENEILPDYLNMWFRRKETDRWVGYISGGDVRGGISWDMFLEMDVNVPSIEKQREIVAQYQAVENKIKVNEQICEKLEATAQTLYKQWFVDFEFPCLPSGYRPHGQVNQNLPIDEYITKIGSVCTYSRVGGLPVSDGKTWFVYLILCENDSVYKGMTNDLYRRFYEHYMGEGAEWTKLNKPLKVIHWESFATKEEAAKREKDLKTGYGRTWISRQIEKAGGITQLKTSLAAPQTELRTAGKMVYNQELEKEIPEGWEVKKINSIAKVKHGYAFLGEDFSEVETEKVLVSPGNFKISGGFNFEKNKFYLGQINKNYILKKNDLIVNMTDLSKAGDTLGNTAFIPNISFKILLHNQRVGLFCFDEHFYNYYVYLLTQSKEYKHYILGTATGTTVRHTSPDRICDYDFIKPNMDILVTFNKIIEPIMNKIGLQISIKYKLTQLQSLLLSRLATLEGR
ncbi:GIY-YIG nuclease family protein [Empedobacter falsenii]|uniref:GIY-YIG nuclease family protein n=1 Tax=Empedobacter falsenii TaxID=343874 RepID=A0ABY8V8G9_9FLAO|nr:GIY-YIG nuclease family protein [Empedobacter falsenii]WIH97407.1 GIY-YIG nuclease family protein [Empedobacter falsenii]